MTALKKYWYWLILFILISSFTIIFSWLSILRHNAFASGFDLGNMDQTIWNTLHGRFFTLTGDTGSVSRFTIHADLILIFLAPLYAIWDNVRALLIADALFLALGAIPIFLLADKVLKNKISALIIAAVYLLNPAVEWAHMYDFHPVALAIPLMLSAFYLAYTRNWKWYWLFVLLAILTKEEISLHISMIGFYIFFVLKDKKNGLLSILGGILWFSIMAVLIIPHINTSEEHWALSWYTYPSLIDHNYVRLIKDLFEYIVSHVFSKEAFIYYNDLFRSYGYLPLLGLPFLLLSLPEFMINLLSNHDQMRSLILHYDSGIAPALVIATIFGISFLLHLIKKIPSLKKKSSLLLYVISFFLLSCGILANYLYGPLPYARDCWCINYQVNQDDKDFEKLLANIPANASVTASPEIRPHITHRITAFTLPIATASADFIAIIDQNRIVGDYKKKAFELELIKALDKGHTYSLVKHLGHLYLYKKKA